jgi:hypothetical protein
MSRNGRYVAKVADAGNQHKVAMRAVPGRVAAAVRRGLAIDMAVSKLFSGSEPQSWISVS